MIDTNRITNQFNSDAKAYDSKRRIFIPCFDDYYINSTKFIASVINKPSRVLDLGARLIKDGKEYRILRRYQHSQAKRANINYRIGKYLIPETADYKISEE